MIKLAIVFVGLGLSIFCGFMTIGSTGLFGENSPLRPGGGIPIINDIKQFLGLPPPITGSGFLSTSQFEKSPSSNGEGGHNPPNFFKTPQDEPNKPLNDVPPTPFFRIFIVSSTTSTPETTPLKPNMESSTMKPSLKNESSQFTPITGNFSGNGERDAVIMKNESSTEAIVSLATEVIPRTTLQPPFLETDAVTTTPSSSSSSNSKNEANSTSMNLSDSSGGMLRSNFTTPVSNRLYLPPNREYLPPKQK